MAHCPLGKTYKERAVIWPCVLCQGSFTQPLSGAGKSISLVLPPLSLSLVFSHFPPAVIALEIALLLPSTSFFLQKFSCFVLRLTDRPSCLLLHLVEPKSDFRSSTSCLCLCYSGQDHHCLLSVTRCSTPTTDPTSFVVSLEDNRAPYPAGLGIVDCQGRGVDICC